MKRKTRVLALVMVVCLLSVGMCAFADGIEERASMVEANQGAHQTQGDLGGVFSAMLNSTQEIYAAAGISASALRMIGRTGGGPTESTAAAVAQVASNLPEALKMHPSWLDFHYDIIMSEEQESLLSDYQVVYMEGEMGESWYVKTTDTGEDVGHLTQWMKDNDVRTNSTCQHGPDDPCMYK